MAYYVCNVPVCPVRSEPVHRSEQVSQLLFGEVCELIESEGDFIKVRCCYDDYVGWCQVVQLASTGNVKLTDDKQPLAAGWVNQVKVDKEIMYVPFASIVNVLTDQNINYDLKVITTEEQQYNDESLVKYASLFLNTSYQWGGRSVFGVDCSGFTQVVYKCLGIKLLRDASQQAQQGDAIGFVAEARCGDLAFFDNEAGKITHVGIMLNNNSIIHASGKVKIDTIDNYGIINSASGKRTHNLRVIKRVVTT